MVKGNNNQSIEDYLKSILVIKERQGYARSIDVARFLGVTNPSACVAMRKLKEQGYVTMDDSSHLFLTDEGKKLAEKVYGKHRLLRDVLVAIGVAERVAEEEACNIEHMISDDTYHKIDEFYKEYSRNSRRVLDKKSARR